MGPEGKKLLNIIILGFGFMFMFTAFQTCGNIEVSASFNLSVDVVLSSHMPQLTKTAVIEICLSPSAQQTVIKSFNSTEFHGSGYTRLVHSSQHKQSFTGATVRLSLASFCNQVHLVQEVLVG